jgi:hypothetical protein
VLAAPGQGNHSSSDSSPGDFYGGDYTEAVLSYAYRSVELDRLHTLAKYTYFYNMLATDQVFSGRPRRSSSRRAHIAASYDINQYFSLGGKYARSRS